MTEIDDAIARLAAATAGFVALRPAVEAGRPWPLHDVSQGDGPESAWGPTEVLAHVAEMLSFWLGEIERVVDGSVEPIPFGRTIDDQVRRETIARDRTLPPVELVGRIETTAGRYARRLPEIGPAGLARRGLHPVRGEMTVAAILERFVVEHAEDHVAQLRDALGSTDASGATAAPDRGG
jgi:DinB superfamily